MSILWDHTTEEIIKALLLCKPQLRDDDLKLIFYVHCRQLGENRLEGTVLAQRLSQLSTYEYAKKIINKELAPFESIRRCRQKLQEFEYVMEEYSSEVVNKGKVEIVKAFRPKLDSLGKKIPNPYLGDRAIKKFKNKKARSVRNEFANREAA